MQPPFSQRLRRLFLETGNRSLDFRRPGARALLILLALAASAALAAASWLAYLEYRDAAVAVTDPRQAYVENIRQKIQAATEIALAALPPGERAAAPLLRIRVSPGGALISVGVERPSGDPALDELAQRIVREAAPFEPFSPEMRRTTNIVEITSAFTFH